MKTSPKPFLKILLGFLTISILLFTSCKEEESDDPLVPIVYFQIVLEENGTDVFQSESYNLDSLRLFTSNVAHNYTEITGTKFHIYISEVENAVYMGAGPNLSRDTYFFDYGNGDIDTLEWLSDFRDSEYRNDIYRIYFNGVLNHEIRMNKELLNNMARESPEGNIIYPLTKK